MKKIGLYIHIPFCNGKCPYCDFYSIGSNSEEMDQFVTETIKYLDRYKDDKILIDTIYFGGGTPSILGTERLVFLLKQIYGKMNVAKNAEVTMEVNPSSALSLDFIKLKKSGLNRVSVGMQSAVDSEMKLLGRKHKKDEVILTIKKLQNSGIDNFSLDLMIGVPYQTNETLKESMNFCKSMGAKHISAYILKFEEGTPFYQNKHKMPIKNEDEQAEQYLYVCNYLESIGYIQYEISNFSKEGYESRHNNKYWQCNEYIGIGPSAHSFYNGKRFYSNRSIEDFCNGITVDDGIGGNEEEFIMLNLRLRRGLIFDEYRRRYNKELSKTFFNKCKLMQDAGYIIMNENKVSLTKEGYLVSNSIISELI